MALDGGGEPVGGPGGPGAGMPVLPAALQTVMDKIYVGDGRGGLNPAQLAVLEHWFGAKFR